MDETLDVFVSGRSERKTITREYGDKKKHGHSSCIFPFFAGERARQDCLTASNTVTEMGAMPLCT